MFFGKVEANRNPGTGGSRFVIGGGGGGVVSGGGDVSGGGVGSGGGGATIFGGTSTTRTGVDICFLAMYPPTPSSTVAAASTTGIAHAGRRPTDPFGGLVVSCLAAVP